MASWGRADFEAFRNLQEKIQSLEDIDMDAFCTECSKEIAARLLSLVVRRTPVGKYPSGSGKVGGTLRRGWGVVADINVVKEGDTYTVTIINPVEYASYVEFGHRTRNGGYVEPQLMLTISEEKLKNAIPKLLERKVKKKLMEALSGGN
jgi:hypothetical protein